MRILSDTHIFIWFSQDSSQLSRSAHELLRNPENEIFLSMASIWEIQIKLDIKKLTLPLPLAELIALQRRENNIQILPIELHHIYALSDLPMHHRDPFDRLLIAQSNAERMPILTADAVFDRYNAQILR